MTNEVILERDAREIALKINTIKQQTFRTALMAAVEIGELLCEAKEQVPHGAWGDWLAENVAYSVSTANNMMRLYRERESMAQLDMFSADSWDMFEGMSPTKVLALLDVPAGERREFIEQTGADSADMSVSQVKKAIKEKEEAEERAKAAEERAESAEELRAAISERLETAETQLALLKAMGTSEEDRQKIEKEAADKAKADADKKIAAAKKKAEQDLERAKKEGAEAIKKVEAEREAAIANAREEAKKAAEKEAEARIAALEDKLKRHVVAASPHMERFKAHLETFQEAYRRMLSVVEDAEQEAPEVALQLKRVMGELVKRLVPSTEGEGEGV